MSRMTVEELGPPAPLALTSVQIKGLAGTFGDPWTSAWADVQAVAQKVWQASAASNPNALSWSWHHLLLACGNFKRRTGPIVPPKLTLPTPPVAPPANLGLPGGALLSCEQPHSWEVLRDVEGIGYPTASTILAALWPSRHAIFDVRTRIAAVALAPPLLQPLQRKLAKSRVPPQGWDFYDWYRLTVISTGQRPADTGMPGAVPCEPYEVERALWFLYGRVGLDSQGSWPWSEFLNGSAKELARF